MSDEIKPETYTRGNETKESFCGACLAVPLAFAGAGASAYGSGSKGKHKKQKKIMFWLGIISVLISLGIAVYYLWIKKCDDCQ
jgi:hypothetical protein